MVRNLVFLLALLGVISLSASSVQRDRDECGPFTIGVSAIGGCDYLH
jgi:hypothetical protein